MIAKRLYMIFAAMASAAFVFQAAQAETQKAVSPSEFQRAVEACFTPPPGATGAVVIAATFEADGSLDKTPVIIEKGNGAIDQAFANAAMRAVLRCQPQLAAMGIQGEVRFNFAPPPAQETDGVSPNAPSEKRLQKMQDAAQRLQAFAERNHHSREAMRPTNPAVSKILDTLCNPGEAEKLDELSPHEYKTVVSYTRSLIVVMNIYEDPATARSQKAITDNMRGLGACLDATLWSSRAAVTVTKKMFSEMPELSSNPKAATGRDQVYSNIGLVIVGSLEALALDGMEASWCDARLAPLTALFKTAYPVMPDKQKVTLRSAMRQAEKCSDQTRLSLKSLLQPRHP